LNEREKTIRKYEQEIDSYSFRNQQLEKRVAILQGDLTEKAKKGSKKGESKKNEADHQESSPHNSVPLNELLSKIDENVQLTRQVNSELQISFNHLSLMSNAFLGRFRNKKIHSRNN